MLSGKDARKKLVFGNMLGGKWTIMLNKINK